MYKERQLQREIYMFIKYNIAVGGWGGVQKLTDTNISI